MHILLHDSDPKRRERWSGVIVAQGHKVIADLKELPSDKRDTLKVAMMTWQDDLLWTEQAMQLVGDPSNKLLLSVCFFEPAQLRLMGQAFEIGFDECLPLDIDADTIIRKLQWVEQLLQLNNRLAQAQKLESLGELAAGIAHEINTPIQYVGDNTRFVRSAFDDLNEVIVHSQKMVNAGLDPAELEGALAELQAALEAADVEYLQEELPAAISQTLEGIDRVATIVRAMKAFSHPGGSEKTITDISDCINNTLMVARNEWKYVADVETQFDPNLPSFPCLPGELNQVFLNMIVNASHAISDAIDESTGEKGKITITTRHTPPYAEIQISDSGAGIAPENLDRIFAPFFTTKALGKGTGQGLAIAHSVITEKHGGHIRVESELGSGTSFVMQIPLEGTVNENNSDETVMAY